MPSVICPGCARRIELPYEDMDLAYIQCARCDTYFNPWTGQRVIVQRVETGPAEPARSDPEPELDFAEGDHPGSSGLPPINFGESFVWWQQQFPGRTYPFTCPVCGTTIQLRQRVTQAKRTCPGCGYRIDMAAIDGQLEAMEPERHRRMHPGCGCAATAVLLALACTSAALVLVWSA